MKTPYYIVLFDWKPDPLTTPSQIYKLNEILRHEHSGTASFNQVSVQVPQRDPIYNEEHAIIQARKWLAQYAECCGINLKMVTYWSQ